MTVIKSHVSEFSTEMLPERERFDEFLEEIARKLIRVDVTSHAGAHFYANMRSVGLGPVICNAIDYSAASWGRTPKLLTDGNDDFVFHICEASPYLDSVRDEVVGEGQGVLVDNSQASSISNTTGGSALVLVIPRKVLLGRVPAAEDLAQSGIVGDRTELRLLRGYLSTLLNAPPVTPETLRVAGSHVLDLMALVLGGAKEMTQEDDAGGVRAARSLAVRQSIMDRLHDPSMTLAGIAKANSVSERSVQRLFETLGTSFSDYVLHQRLEVAHQLLISSQNLNRKIADIAIEAGFSDLSYFNRSFRSRYGDTPSGVRIASLRS